MLLRRLHNFRIIIKLWPHINDESRMTSYDVTRVKWVMTITSITFLYNCSDWHPLHEKNIMHRKHHSILGHYDDVSWTPCSLKSPVIRLCVTAYASKKHQSPHYWPFVRGTDRWPANSPHKGLVTRKSFHLMTSSWIVPESYTHIQVRFLVACRMHTLV